MVKAGKIITIILWAIVLVSAILIISLMTNINSENEADPTMASWIGTNLNWAYILFIVAGLIAVFAGLFQMFTEKKALKSGLMVLGFFIVVVAIAYVFTDEQMPTFLGVDKFIQDGTLTPKISRMIGLGLNTTYVLIIIAIGSIIWSSVSRLFK